MGAVRTRSAAGLRVDLSAAGRAGERRLRRAARPRASWPRPESTLVRPARTSAGAARARSERHPRGNRARVAVHPRPLAARALRRRRCLPRRRAGDEDVTPARTLCEAHAMATTHAEAHIARDADEVWKVFGDFQAIKTWFPGLQDVKPDGPDVR